MAIGKSLYGKHCKSCHGSKGYGDGTKDKEMKGEFGYFQVKNSNHKPIVHYSIKQLLGEMICQTSFR